MRSPLIIMAACALLASCGGSGGVADAVGTFTSPYLAIDLASGKLEAYANLDADAVRSDPQWKTTKLLFRRLELGGTIGVSGSALGVDSDEPTPRTVAPTVMFVAVFEVTQVQWTALGGTARWLEPGLRAAGGSVVAASAPAYGLNRDEVESVTAAYHAGRDYLLALPTNDQWEVACRGGTSGTLFWWGDAPSDAVGVEVRAVVAESAGSMVGAQAVDSGRSANPAGLYDLHGNVWEWVDSPSGTVRGGSWNDTVAQARAANRLALDQTIHHPLVGARLLLIP
ncbi:MAG: formylglycine-generating enzyme family protein [Planctomycetes bacterium]|jgi:formylglycine-generating enzyme required for sulfatase activity|nr:formylglycine-generating enzyme family protein [Planctomycetota bacterium]